MLGNIGQFYTDLRLTPRMTAAAAAPREPVPATGLPQVRRPARAGAADDAPDTPPRRDQCS